MICPFDPDEDCIYPEDYVPCEECEIWRSLYESFSLLYARH